MKLIYHILISLYINNNYWLNLIQIKDSNEYKV